MIRPPLCRIPMQWLVALLLLLPLQSQAQVRALDLREMVTSAGMIFVGTVTEVRGGYDEHGDIVTYTTFSIQQPIAGVFGGTVTIKQLGGEAGGLSTRLEHARYFTQRERVLAMFYPVSALGFTSPVGLEQAVWNVGADDRLQGVRPAIMRGLESLMTQHGINLQSGIERAKFVALINDLRAPGKTLKKGGSNQ